MLGQVWGILSFMSGLDSFVCSIWEGMDFIVLMKVDGIHGAIHGAMFGQ